MSPYLRFITTTTEGAGARLDRLGVLPASLEGGAHWPYPAGQSQPSHLQCLLLEVPRQQLRLGREADDAPSLLPAGGVVYHPVPQHPNNMALSDTLWTALLGHEQILNTDEYLRRGAALCEQTNRGPHQNHMRNTSSIELMSRHAFSWSDFNLSLVMIQTLVQFGTVPIKRMHTEAILV